ncbi:MAG: DUF1611 domain-containing protein [Fimbriimonadaceae bacterium]|nr:DUF1611 domain-containing protein [Fimbriimonadaceae bacterium]
MLDPKSPVALYMPKNLVSPIAKMGHGVLRFLPNPVVAVIDPEHAGRNTAEFNLPRAVPVVATVEDAAAAGAKVLILGIAPLGGQIPAEWWPDLDRALELGISLVNGLHDLLMWRYPHAPEPGIVDPSVPFVWDIRREPPGLVNGRGLAATLKNRRALLIGTDMSVGKMTAGLELHAAAKARGIRSEFVATGQIGITVTGSGVALDAVRVDFASGAIEQEVLMVSDRGAEIVWVEGQGSLVHPSSTANLPLIRGSVPTDFVLCVRAGQRTLRFLDHIEIPPLRELIGLYEQVAGMCGRYPIPATRAVAVNTAHLSDEAEAADAIAQIAEETGLVAADPVRDPDGPNRLLDAMGL